MFYSVEIVSYNVDGIVKFYADEDIVIQYNTTAYQQDPDPRGPQITDHRFGPSCVFPYNLVYNRICNIFDSFYSVHNCSRYTAPLPTDGNVKPHSSKKSRDQVSNRTVYWPHQTQILYMTSSIGRTEFAYHTLHGIRNGNARVTL